MELVEYGKELKSIGKEISEISGETTEIPLSENLSENIAICKKTVQKLKGIEPPPFVRVEHKKLIKIFDRLITAYSLQLESSKNERHNQSSDLYVKGKKMVEEETQKIWPIFIAILTNSSHFMFHQNQK
ncbi:hypothetical protein M3182_03595 [Mesobacillus maritimus]|uniref:hypothetical protein n=1 Tax=Mesobacillus maritimus TaxID=1643336 RepID=UPI0020410EB0|nr:hypothetical protein [Mesobacillus maritimus]MCM3584828.1 hypothetical protein [Mesobacillus maritimus]MCM3671243.1 hypothetical protein [Mesobacillus maritimus]